MRLVRFFSKWRIQVDGFIRWCGLELACSLRKRLAEEVVGAVFVTGLEGAPVALGAHGLLGLHDFAQGVASAVSDDGAVLVLRGPKQGGPAAGSELHEIFDVESAGATGDPAVRIPI